MAAIRPTLAGPVCDPPSALAKIRLTLAPAIRYVALGPAARPGYIGVRLDRQPSLMVINGNDYSE